MNIAHRLVMADRFMAITFMGEKEAKEIVMALLTIMGMDKTEKNLYGLMNPENPFFDLDNNQLSNELMGVLKQLN